MEVLVIHNRDAGANDQHEHELHRRLAAAGHHGDVVTLDDDGWAAAVAGHDLVVVGGGDGTVRQVFTRLAADGCTVPVTILATGTANNTARTLGIPTEEPLAWITGWETAAQVRFHLPRVDAPGLDRLCVEGVGVGMLADLLRTADRRAAQAGDDEVDPIEVARDVFARAPEHDLTVHLDGVDLSGRYVGVHAMNVREAGPNLAIAPDASAHDGVLDLVLLGDADRHALLEHAERGEGAPPPTVVRRGEQATITLPDGVAVIVDDQPVEVPGGSALRVAARGKSLVTLVPAAERLTPLERRLWS